jgi:hypothetical protein
VTGYDNTDANSPAGEPRHDEEVFEYDAVSKQLACASCNPAEARPVGFFDGEQNPLIDRDELWRNRWLAGSVPGWTRLTTLRSVYQSRYLSDEGRLFFDSPDLLVPADSDGKENVYEYEPAGVGPKHAPCAPGVDSRREVFKAAHAYAVTESEGQQAAGGEEPAGCVGLISSGESSEESAFIEASSSGNDVFFITTSQLVPADYDTSYDMYDAHVCSEETTPCFPENAAVPPACTDGASCKAAPTLQPAIFGAPSSQTFSGAGNVPSPLSVVKKVTIKKSVKCKSGYVKKKVKKKEVCVQKPKKSKKKSAHKSAKGRK